MTERVEDAWLAPFDEIPYAPRDLTRDPRHYALATKSAFDFVAHNMPRFNSLLVRLNPYPAPFEKVRVRVDAEGTTLGGWFARGREGAPAILLAPGTFQTKDDNPRKARAIKLQREWGCHVLVVDLRGFGESHAALGTGGYLEAHDLLACAKWLRAQTGVARVALVGESLGGASAFIAAALPGAADEIAGVAAWSPFADLLEQAAYSTKNPGVRHPFYLPYRFYRLMTTARSRGQVRDFHDFLRLRSATLGIEPEELARRSSPVTYASEVAVPVLVHHAEDDPIVPVEHARLLAEASKSNPHVRVRVLPRGGHVGFEEHDPSWYWSTLRSFVARLDAGTIREGSA